jgi:hypothetical protein
MSLATPWAILFCKFKDDVRGFVSINLSDRMAMLAGPHAESAAAYWQDVTYGALDLSGSKAFGWVTLSQKQSEYVGSGSNQQGRRDLVTWAKDAASDAGIDLSPYFGVVVFMSTPTDLWGSPKTVVCDVDSPLAAILQEYGHGYGLSKHSRAVSTPTTDYTNPLCAMSAMTFGGMETPTHLGRFGTSGPLICSPYVDVGGWLPANRIQTILTVGGARPKLTTLRLSALGDRMAAYPQVARFDFDLPYQASYYVEYRTGGWDRGLAQAMVAAHQRRPDGYAYYAGSVVATAGAQMRDGPPVRHSWTDSDFDLSVRVERVLDAGKAIELTIGSRAAIRPLSVRRIAESQLHLTALHSVRGQIMRFGNTSLTRSLLQLLDE